MTDCAWWPHTADPGIASTRMRCARVVAELRRRGKDVRLYSTASRAPKVLVLSKRYDPESVRHADRLRAEAGTRLVLDLCDNHFYAANPDAIWHARAQALREAVARMDLVVASTPALASTIRDECRIRCEIAVIGDAFEAPSVASSWQRIQSPRAEWQLAWLRAQLSRTPVHAGRRLLWFGNHGDDRADWGMKDLLRIRARLEDASTQAPLSLTIVSNSALTYRQVTKGWALPTYYLDWAITTFPRVAAMHDIATIPISTNPFTICKSSNRVATAIINGLAVAADSIPSYEEFASSAVLDDWGQGLDALMANSSLRQALVDSGTGLIKDKWNIARIADQWALALDI